ncbi:hypothetical protein ASC77_05785 [Nocardioides sp. Root1257]|uniref:DUF389 domain-containing protein n=1 Tax=unclassified Nocardioides TaxID=2615069 RepID=UPI0006F4D9F8|nr:MULTISPECIES: DUF389 domain-containing protein [unclassified Nocardioides]KQW53765.1 hypothetical protein ASC77_05785 [Nocardioides sp. Root1257]KRC56451.1 hypothetical protein ASE24_05785 [Nocardioides sp. Root224]
MARGLRAWLLPEGQRRTLDELTDDLDLRSGDATAKRSAFWTMLTLSAVIASAGVLADSTATVIGAMIIAPLSTPIMGMAVAVVKQQRNWSLLYVTLGSLEVIAIGAIAVQLQPGIVLLDNSQISGRTSPGLVDLVAALATGLAGAVALARRDVAAVLPGVAIAISLVPPLAVVGVCLGAGELELALGALVLFLSNTLALVLAGIAMFTLLGYTDEALVRADRFRGRTYVVLAVVGVLVTIPLAANTVATFVLTRWENDVQDTAETWLADTPDAQVTDVEFHALVAYVYVQHSGELPSYARLLSELGDVLPDGIKVVVDSTVGQEVPIGTVGDG